MCSRDESSTAITINKQKCVAYINIFKNEKRINVCSILSKKCSSVQCARLLSALLVKVCLAKLCRKLRNFINVLYMIARLEKDNRWFQSS